MKARILIITVAGVLALGAAAWVRHRYVTSRAYKLARAMDDPRFQRMGAEVGRLQAAVARTPSSTKDRWALADMYQRLSLVDLAEEQLREIVKLDPQDTAAQIALANAELALVHPDVAKGLFQRISQKWPKEPDGWQGLAVIAYHDHRYEDAVRAIRKAVALRPADPSYRYILGNALQAYAQQFPRTETYAVILVMARKEYERLAPTWPDQADIQLRLGNVCSNLGDQKAAVAHYVEAVKRLPNRPDVATELAVAYMKNGKKDEAQSTVDSAIARGPAYAPLYALRGTLLQRSTDAGTPAKVVEAYRKAVQLAPNNATYNEQLGTALLRVQNYPEARTALEKAVALNPEKAAPYQQLAAVYTRLGETKLAGKAAFIAGQMVFNEQQLKQIEELSASDPQNMNLHLILADRYRDLGMLDAADAKYRLVLKFKPGNVRAVNGLAEVEKRRVARRA